MEMWLCSFRRIISAIDCYLLHLLQYNDLRRHLHSLPLHQLIRRSSANSDKQKDCIIFLQCIMWNLTRNDIYSFTAGHTLKVYWSMVKICVLAVTGEGYISHKLQAANVTCQGRKIIHWKAVYHINYLRVCEFFFTGTKWITMRRGFLEVISNAYIHCINEVEGQRKIVLISTYRTLLI